MTLTRTEINSETGLPEVVPLTQDEITALLAEKGAAQADADAKAVIEAARHADLGEIAGDKVTAALTQITNDETARDTDETAVDTDLASVSTATNTQLRDMVGRMLAREKKALNREARSLARQRAIIRKLSRVG